MIKETRLAFSLYLIRYHFIYELTLNDVGTWVIEGFGKSLLLISLKYYEFNANSRPELLIFPIQMKVLPCYIDKNYLFRTLS